MDSLFKLDTRNENKASWKNAEIRTVVWLMGAKLLGSPTVFSPATIEVTSNLEVEAPENRKAKVHKAT